MVLPFACIFFFFNDTATTEIYTLSLHDALPISIMAAIDWKIGLIALATLPFLAYSLLHLYRKTKLSVKTQKKQEGKVASRMSEVLQAVPLVQAVARERDEAEPFDAVTEQTVRESIRVARLQAAATPSPAVLPGLG